MEFQAKQHGSSFPIQFPPHDAFTFPNDQFQTFLRDELRQQRHVSNAPADSRSHVIRATGVSESGGWAAVSGLADSLPREQSTQTRQLDPSRIEERQSFLGALKKGLDSQAVGGFENKMLTDNADAAFKSSTDPLVDLFSELEYVVAGERLRELLDAAWKADPLVTLKLIFNARSIHLGKGSRASFYRCVGWLVQKHPLTLLLSLPWLNRPLIEKKAARTNENEEDIEIVEVEKTENDPMRFDVKNGASHGYYKNLLNILALAVNDKLSVLTDHREVLNVQVKRKGKKFIEWDADKAKELRHNLRDSRHAAAVSKFQNDSFYRCLHITVVRIFAEQLAWDLQLLRSGDAKSRRRISLCAKWAPSQKLFHDQHTIVVTSIAETLHPQLDLTTAAQADRTSFLQEAREAYRKEVSSLRRALAVVERDISAETFDKIRYERVPSLAMNRYTCLFIQKDYDRFETYSENVAEGKNKISRATLLPAELISQARKHRLSGGVYFGAMAAQKSKQSPKALVKWKVMTDRQTRIDIVSEILVLSGPNENVQEETLTTDQELAVYDKVDLWCQVLSRVPRVRVICKRLETLLSTLQDLDLNTSVWMSMVQAHPDDVYFNEALEQNDRLRKRKKQDAELQQLHGEKWNSICDICMEQEYDTVLNCGHICCSQCASMLEKCHTCRKPVHVRIKVYARLLRLDD